MRILAVDPGEKNLGIAVSDPTGTIATPTTVIKHLSRQKDAARIAALAAETGCGEIVVGLALSDEGGETESSRRARNLASELRRTAGLPVVLWDEAGSTQTARETAIEMGVRRSKRSGHLDANAAAVILQTYLESGDRGGR